MLSIRRFFGQTLVQASRRCLFAGRALRTSPDDGEKKYSDGELRIMGLLREAFPDAFSVQVLDVSNGCGSMYEVYVASKKFEGIRTLQQHKMINEVLKEEIKGMHGLRITTSPIHPPQ